MIQKPKKKLGQHFLTSPEIIDTIVNAVSPSKGEIIVEIGAGQGAITDPFSNVSSELHAIEYDRDLTTLLRKRFSKRKNVTIHEANVLEFNFSSLGNQLRLIGNLPYNISTPILFYILLFEDHISDMHFMLQKEVADRLCAIPGNKNYGRLSIMIGCRIEIIKLFDVAPEAFNPRPKVISSVVRMRPQPKGKFNYFIKDNLNKIVKLGFSKRRKKLYNALAPLITSSQIKKLNINPNCRPEEISIQEWIELSEILNNQQCQH